jgi:tRNA(Ile)-lysidine synthetase-like protein
MKDIYPNNRLSSSFERKIYKILTHVIDDKSKMLLACSAGTDSTALLVLMARCYPKHNIEVAYFDHRTRSNRAHQEEYVFLLEVCNNLGVKIHRGVLNKKIKKQSEEALRLARYQWLSTLCSEEAIQCIVTGHHLNDQAETLLFRLARGTSLDGIQSMQMLSQLNDEMILNKKMSSSIFLLRPLLNFAKKDLKRYLDSLGIEAISDPSNNDIGYSRNLIRKKVLPSLEKINPKAIHAIARFALIAKKDDDALLLFAKENYSEIVTESNTSVKIDIEKLNKLPDAIIIRIIILSCRYLNISINSDQIQHIIDLKDKNRSIYSLSKAEVISNKKVITIKQLI